MSKNYLDEMILAQKRGEARGIYSICSAHPVVLEAAMRFAREDESLLIESTCNQVNQFGGYTGMKPVDFVRFVHDIADKVGFDKERLILGGDHLGPLPWSNEPAQAAMEKAIALVRDYVHAGYTKIHLDASMACADDRNFSLDVIASRTVELAKVAEENGGEKLRYVVGSEVPAAGGTHAGDEGLVVTSPASAGETLDVMKQAFRESDAEAAWGRVIALVVQPGVEFGDQSIHVYQRAEAKELKRFIESVPGIVFEAHSTDYQTSDALKQLVEDHFAILKVGPALTFSLREAVFALAMMESELGFAHPSNIREELENAMLANPTSWQKHYRGNEAELKFARQFSFSDRIRYYWDDPKVREAFKRLVGNFGERSIPISLLSQHMPKQYSRIRSGSLRNHVHDLMMDAVQTILYDYSAACSSS